MRALLTTLVAFLTVVYAGDGKFGGLVFYDFTGDLTKDADISNEFGLKRVYFTYQQELSEGIHYKFQTDIDYSHSPKNLYLKNAKVDWSSPIGKLTFGLQGMNVFNIQEKTWGYRFIEKSAMDQRKFASSADMGIGYSKKFADLVNVSTLYTNGTGYKKAESDSYKKLSIQATVGEKKLVKKDGYNVGGVFTYEPYDIPALAATPADTTHEWIYDADGGHWDELITPATDAIAGSTEGKTLLGVFVGYAGSGIRAGGEFDRLSDAGSEKTKQILSIYGNYKVLDHVSVYGRLDIYDPDTDTDKDGEKYIIAGVLYSPGKGLTIAPNIRMVSPEEGDGTTLIIVNFEFKF